MMSQGEFRRFLEDEFGPLLTNDLKSALCMSFHHVNLGSLARTGHRKGKKVPRESVSPSCICVTTHTYVHIATGATWTPPPEFRTL